MGTFTFLMALIIVVCVLVILVILSQNPKGGGLSSTFGGSGGGQMFGVQRTNEFLDKATWTLASIIVILIITANVLQENPYATATVPVNEVPVELPAQQSAPTPDAPATTTPTNTPPPAGN